MKATDLRGKRWLNQAEAAHYTARSLSQFKLTTKRLGIPSFMLDGIRVYDVHQLDNIIEKERLRQ